MLPDPEMGSRVPGFKAQDGPDGRPGPQADCMGLPG